MLSMNEGRDNFIMKLKEAGRIAREKILQNADEETRLRFLLDEHIRKSNQGVIIKETLKK